MDAFFGDGVSAALPGNLNLSSLTSPGIQANTGSWNQVLSNVSFDRNGLPKGITTNYEMPSNTFISHTYYARAWANKAELKMPDGSFAFIFSDSAPIRVRQSVYDVHVLAGLGHLNMILQQAWTKFQAMIREAGTAGNEGSAEDQEAFRLNQLLQMFSETEIQAAEWARLPETPVEAKDLRKMVPPQLLDITRMATARLLRYVVAPMHVWRYWKLAGVVRAAAGAMSGVQNLAESDRVVSVTLTTARRAEIYDIFGGCDDGAYCWFILRRVSLGGRKSGAFQYVPYASAVHSFPPDSEVMYWDLAGNWTRGVCFYVGRISLVPRESGRHIARGHLEVATGKHTKNSLDLQQRALLTLDTVTIQLFE
jgi:hypothetical protein